MSEVKVNKISPRTNCGTVQLGDSGDTITIPAGATITNNGTQTGFGRTGTVDWQTTKKTASFTAVSGEGYFVDTTSSAITVTLPASPSGGAIVSVKDYAQTFATNNCTIARNSSNIEGVASDVTLDGDAESVTFVYVDSTKGWVLVGESLTKYGPAFVAATGGTITTCGNFKIHTFTGPGTFTVTCAGNSGGSNSVDYLVVAGGGGGGGNRNLPNANGGGGGGAGGYRESGGTASGCYTVSPLGSSPSPVAALPVSAQGYPITVGGGGAGGPHNSPTVGTDGNNSVFSTITSTAGGGGAASNSVGGRPGGNGGGGGPGEAGTTTGGNGNTPPVTPPQGTNGLSGGGGNGGYGGSALGCNVGATSSINGTPTARAGGGGAGTSQPGAPGGGGNSGAVNASGTAGTANTGGGGGGGGPGSGGSCGGTGGSGIVIIRYKFQ